MVLFWCSSITLLPTNFSHLFSQTHSSHFSNQIAGWTLDLLFLCAIRWKLSQGTIGTYPFCFLSCRNYCPPLSLCLSLRVPFKPSQERVSPTSLSLRSQSCLYVQRRKKENETLGRCEVYLWLKGFHDIYCYHILGLQQLVKISNQILLSGLY